MSGDDKSELSAIERFVDGDPPSIADFKKQMLVKIDAFCASLVDEVIEKPEPATQFVPDGEGGFKAVKQSSDVFLDQVLTEFSAQDGRSQRFKHVDVFRAFVTRECEKLRDAAMIGDDKFADDRFREQLMKDKTLYHEIDNFYKDVGGFNGFIRHTADGICGHVYGKLLKPKLEAGAVHIALNSNSREDNAPRHEL